MWALKSGETVVNRHRSHIHPGVAKLLPEALGRVDAAGRNFLVEEVDFGRVVGETVCVPTTDADEIVWAKRPKRFGLSRFVKNRNPEPCSAVVVILKAGDRGDYILITAFVGRRAEPEPWDRNLRDAASRRRSREFWDSHALVWGSEEVVPGTETTSCPW